MVASRLVRVSEPVWAILDTRRRKMAQKQGRPVTFDESIRSILQLLRIRGESLAVRATIAKAVSGRPASLGEVYDFAERFGVPEEVAHTFWTFNDAKGWKGITNWRGALRAFAKKGGAE